MQKYIVILFLFISSTAISQTELIRHKSHSGTNKTFIPTTNKDNFGEIVIIREYKKDTSSSYKLISNGSTFILFKTNDKALDDAVCMLNDEVLQTVEINDPELIVKTKEFLIGLLKDYRKEEKEQSKPE